MNYDFKKNWYDIILPLLSLPKVKKSIKTGIKKYIDSENCFQGVEYDSCKCPASYQRGDGWYFYINEYEEKLTEHLLETGFLKKDENEPLSNENGELDDYIDDPNYEKYMNYKEEAIRPFIKYHESTSLRAYQMFGACHWWNSTFCLTLAKIIYPNELWRIKEGFYHTTVTNLDESLLFDILYFDENDNTKGGDFALSESKKTEK